jgi:S1-C subfamily serine protease
MASPQAADAPAWRDRLLPKSVLGMATLILALAVGSAASGVAFYSYYEYKKDTTARSVSSYAKDFAAAEKTIQAEKTNAKAEIAKELEPLKKIRAEGETLDALGQKVKGSLFFISTLDEAGQPSVGTAFAVASDSQQTLLLASYATVRAATRQPGPPGGVRIRQGDQDLKGTLWTWEEGRDLAVIVLSKGNVPKLSFAAKDPPLKSGERVFAASGLGAAGGAVTSGFVADVSAAGIQHDAAIGQAFQGGPLLNSDGDVVGVASRTYAPLNFASDGVWFAPLIRMSCDKVLRCPSGTVSGAGDRQQPAAPATTTTVKR